MTRMPMYSLRLFLVSVMILSGDAKGTSVCREKVADVVFLLDSSYSIWEHEFTTQLSFLQDLVDAFTIGPNNIRVGVVTYSNRVRLDVALNDHKDKEGLKKAIGQIQYMKGETRTGDAIHFARTQMFSAENGGRAWAAHIVILITDGLSHDPNRTRSEAHVARSQGIEMFAIGVGKGRADETELRVIASDPDERHVMQVESYSALKNIEQSVARKACHKANASTSDKETDDKNEDTHTTATKRCGGKPADVYFLLDSSSSIWRLQFYDQLHFVMQLLNVFDLGPQRTRVGVAVYSDSVTEVVSFSHPQSRHSVKTALFGAPYLTGRTQTGKALEYVRTQSFAAARPEVAHVIIIITDGQSANVTQTLQEAKKARQEGMYVFAVGVGSQTDVDELMEIASDPNENFVFHVDNFGGLKNIRELLAIKTCDVTIPEVQKDRPDTSCKVSQPTDIIFMYDSSVTSRAESGAITDVIQRVVDNLDQDGDLIRFGLVRENCYKGHNVDIKTGAKAKSLLTLLQTPHHQGLHKLLNRARLHGYLSPYDDKRSRAHKTIVLFVSSKLARPKEVEKELKRSRFQGARVVVVVAGEAREDLDLFRRLSSVDPVSVESTESLPKSQKLVMQRLCEANRLQR